MLGDILVHVLLKRVRNINIEDRTTPVTNEMNVRRTDRLVHVGTVPEREAIDSPLLDEDVEITVDVSQAQVRKLGVELLVHPLCGCVYPITLEQFEYAVPLLARSRFTVHIRLVIYGYARNGVNNIPVRPVRRLGRPLDKRSDHARDAPRTWTAAHL